MAITELKNIAGIKAPETPDELMNRAIAALRDSAQRVARLSSALAGPVPTACDPETGDHHEGFIDRHEVAMRQVLQLASDIYNDVGRAQTRLGM